MIVEWDAGESSSMSFGGIRASILPHVDRSDLTEGPGFVPVEQRSPLAVLERSDQDDDEVDQGPDAQSTEGQDHQDPGSVLLDIESVNADGTEEEAKECGDQSGLIGVRVAHGVHSWLGAECGSGGSANTDPRRSFERRRRSKSGLGLGAGIASEVSRSVIRNAPLPGADPELTSTCAHGAMGPWGHPMGLTGTRHPCSKLRRPLDQSWAQPWHDPRQTPLPTCNRAHGRVKFPWTHASGPIDGALQRPSRTGPRYSLRPHRCSTFIDSKNPWHS